MQAPVEQLDSAFASAHVESHAPQSVSVSSDASHPLFGSESQSPKPLSQLGVHTPPTQDLPPCWLSQTLPQAPQLDVVSSRVSQPLDDCRSQSANPEVHDVNVHTPAAQAVFALANEHG
jgi:hypothetical protein